MNGKGDTTAVAQDSVMRVDRIGANLPWSMA